LKENEIRLISKNPDNEESEKLFISPWTIPGFDFTNLINQYCIFNMIIMVRNQRKIILIQSIYRKVIH